MWKRTVAGDPKTTVRSSPQTKGDEQATLLTSVEVLRPSLDPDASVTGRLSFSRATRLDGTLRGEVRSSALLVIGETGLVNGTVRAAKLLIFGRVIGEVLEAGHVEIARGGELRGDVEARSFVVHEGGRFDGNCKITPPVRATVHILHPERRAPPEQSGTPADDGRTVDPVPAQ